MDTVSIFLGVMGFSLKSIFIKLSLIEGMSVSQVMVMRMLISLPFFISVFFMKKNSNDAESKRGYFSLVFTCSMLYFLSSILDIAGLKFVTVSLERTFLFTIPVFTLLFSYFIFKKKYSKNVIFYCIFSWFGVFVSFISDNGFQNVNINFFFGALLILISALMYSLYMVLSVKGIEIYGSIGFNSRVMSIATIPALLIASGQYSTIITDTFSIHTLAISISLAVFSTVLPSFLMSYGIKKCGPTVVSLFNNIGPFITILSGYLFLGETITVNNFLGLGIVIICVLGINREMNRGKTK